MIHDIIRDIEEAMWLVRTQPNDLKILILQKKIINKKLDELIDYVRRKK